MKQSRTTPGVYISELNAMPDQVMGVPTTIPVFIGFTEKNVKTQSPVMITSVAEYEQQFGKGWMPVFALNPCKPADAQVTLDDGKAYTITNQKITYYLYNGIRLFYENGGGECYVISAGTYTDPVTLSAFQAALALLANDTIGTMLVFPDALLLSKVDYYTFVNDTLIHCNNMQNKVSLIDVYGGDSPVAVGQGSANTSVDDLRSLTGNTGLSYGAVYFPWVQTTVVNASELTCLSFSADELAAGLSPIPQVTKAIADIKAAQQQYVQATTPADQQLAIQAASTAHNELLSCSRSYQSLVNTALALMNLLPVTPAIAGAYVTVDTTQEVWYAPANIALQAVTDASSKITDTTQANLNVDAATGKSVNAVRMFPGRGVLIWGARTLDGNSQDWRYVNTRRTLIMIEQSIKAALQAFVFSPNDSNTWSSATQMINAFLTSQWTVGAIVGPTAASAFSVAVGLGTTMTGDDILNGIMNVSVKVAITHPAEFIVLTFQQQMQTS